MQTLNRELSHRQLFAFSFGSIVGVGWITVMGAWLADAGAFGAALAFLAGAVLVGLISLCYAEMATRFPATGGEIVYVHEVFGLRASFVVGWLLAMGYVSVVIFEVISVGWVVSALFPDLRGPVLYSVGGSDITLLGLGAGILGMVIIAWFNIRGAKNAAFLQELMSLLLVLVTIVFCLAAFVNGDVANFKPYFVRDTDGLIWTGIVAVLVTAPFFFSGFDVVPQAMGERAEKASLKSVPTVLILSVLAAGVFYMMVILAAGIAMPREALLDSDLPMADAIAAALGSSLGGKIVLFAGLLGLITSWNSFTYGGAR
ncbi:MAG: APC family permease, partial [Pseudomonadota bacterium]